MFNTKILATAVALTLAGTAGAVTQTVNTTLDLAVAGFASSGFTYTGGGWTPFPTFALSAGDVLDYTIDFKNNQSLTLTNVNLIWGFVFSGLPITTVTGTGTLSLLDASGAAFNTSLSKTDSEGDVHFGQQFSPYDFTSFPTTVTFYGLHYVGTLDAYDDGITTSRDYQGPQLVLDAANITANVPEPASWALMIAGFGLVGGALRRRRYLTA